MAYSIIFTKGSLQGRSYPIGSNPVDIGRSHKCAIQAARDDNTVSGHPHLILRETNEGLVLFQQGSQPGTTFVDGGEVPQNNKILLTDGSEVEIGKMRATAFKVAIAEGATVAGFAFPGERDAATLTVATSATLPPSVATSATLPPSVATSATLPPQSLRVEAQDADETFTGSADPGTIIDAAENNMQPKSRPGANNKTTPGGTGFMPTPVADSDEIKALIDYLGWQRKLKMIKRLIAVIAIFCAAAVCYWVLIPRPEKELTWPRTPQGAYDTKSVPLSTPWGDDYFTLFVPPDPSMSIKRGENYHVEVETKLGKLHDVPFWISFDIFRNKSYARSSRRELYKRQIKRLEDTGAWNFQAVSPMKFLGLDNGLPCIEVQYLRSVKVGEETQQRFGYLQFSVYADCVIVMLREIPAVEQWRGVGVLARETLLSVSAQALSSRWEGRCDFREEDPEALLAEADGLLALKAPMQWKEVEFLLQSVLIQVEPDSPHYARALDRLKDLRDKERKEFSSLRIAWEQHNCNDDKAACLADINNALRVFSSPEDRRNMLLKKGKWK